ncbi:hypothetical protein NCC49_005619 [Naganishia albida]|nr:hypothetical protein NCC49_005619 [Naganishia albida]
MQHNYESQDGDHRNQEMQDATANSATAASTLSVPAIRRVHSYSGASSGEGTNEGSVNRDHEMTARRTMSALEPTFNFASSTSVGRSVSMHAITSSAANPATATPFESGLVGPSIPLALRRASSDHQHIPGEIRDAATSGMQGKSGFHMGLDSPASFTSGWPSSSSLRMTSTAKTPTTPPKATTFNPGSPSNASTGVGMMTTPVRSSIGLRARANSGTRMRGPGGTFGTPSTGVPSSDTRKRSGSGSGNAASAGPWHARANSQSRQLPLPPSLRATLAADKDLPSSEIRSEGLLQRVIFSNPESLPMTPRPSRRNLNHIQFPGNGSSALFGNGGTGNAGNGYVSRTTSRPPRFLDSTASMMDSDDEDDMQDSSDEDAQFAVDDIMDSGHAPTRYPGSRSGSGSGSASGSVSLGTAIPGIAAEGGMDVDVPMPSGGTTALGSGKLSNRTSMGSLRGFVTGGTPDETGINKNMTAWRESPSSTSNRAQKRKAGHDDSRYEPYGKRHRTSGGDGPLSPLHYTGGLPGIVPPVPTSPIHQYATHHHPHSAGNSASSTSGLGEPGMQIDSSSLAAMNKYGFSSAVAARSRAGSPVANTYAAMRTAVSPVASSPLSMMSGMGLSANMQQPQAAYRPPSSSSGGTTIGMGGMGGIGMLLLSKRNATNPGSTGMGLVSMGDDSGEMAVAEGINGMDVTEHETQEVTEEEDDKMMFD